MFAPQSSPQQVVQQRLQVMKIVTIALMAATFLYGIVLFAIKQPTINTQLFIESLHNPANLILFFAGAAVLLLRVILTNKLLTTSLHNPSVQDFRTAMPAYFVFIILRMALAESAAMFGFVLTLTTGEFSYYLILAAAALVSMIKDFPSEERAKELLKSVRPELNLY
jgi:hypothetical protein